MTKFFYALRKSRVLFLLIASMVFLVMALGAFTPATHAATLSAKVPQSGSGCPLWQENRNSGLALDVYGASKSAGARVIQWPFHNGLNQQWNCLSADGITYQFVNRNSGLVLDVKGASKSAGAQVIQWSNHHGANQMWNIVGNDPQYPTAYYIVNVNSGLVLDVYGGGKTKGVNVIQWPNHHGLNEQWIAHAI
jgi:hypothetical protein